MLQPQGFELSPDGKRLLARVLSPDGFDVLEVDLGPVKVVESRLPPPERRGDDVVEPTTKRKGPHHLPGAWRPPVIDPTQPLPPPVDEPRPPIDPHRELHRKA